MSYEAVDCVDAGTDYCPCYLAETNNCLICSQLQGKAFCDCVNWKGVCIYQELIWNGSKRRELRENINVKVIESKVVNDKVLFFKIKVSRTLARELNQPGSYIFLRGENYPDFFDVPMSVMYSDENNETVDLLVQIRGVKTRVLKDNFEFLTIRAPYWNGVIGLKNIKMTANQNCLIIARGIAQAPSVPVARKLVMHKNNVLVILDKGSSDTFFAESYFERLGCSIIEAEILKNKVFTDEAMVLVSDIIKDKDVKLVFSGGSDIVHRGVLNIVKGFDNEILFSCTNNENICCGEGICGACGKRLKDGRRIKTCKAQINPDEIIGG